MKPDAPASSPRRRSVKASSADRPAPTVPTSADPEAALAWLAAHGDGRDLDRASLCDLVGRLAAALRCSEAQRAEMERRLETTAERAAAAAQDQLRDAIGAIHGGFALYDRDDRLVL